LKGSLIKIALTGRKFTWCNNHENSTDELLDRVLVSPSWEEKFPLVCVSTLSSELSDHTPILIKTGDKPRVPTIFRFENCWLLRPELKSVVGGVWKKTYSRRGNIDKWRKRFECLRKTLKGWNMNIEGEYRKKRGDLASQSDEIDKKKEPYGLTQVEIAAKKINSNSIKDNYQRGRN
jgi:hypothetical protein